MAKQMHYTKEGYQALVDELDYLKTTRRAEAKEALAVARSYGDLSELYEGYRAFVFVDYEKIHNTITMDITTGDSIYPEAILYGFNKVFENQKISLYSYPIETILAEKLETILSRNITTTRPRDFYDVYVLNAKSINQKNLKTALENTCKHRESEKVLKQIPEIILTIKDSENLKEQWKKYSKKMPYAADISFEQVVEKIENLLNLITDGEKKIE